jgi:hypothetical protein
MDKKEIALKIHNAILYVLTHTENVDAHTAFCIQNQLRQEFELVDKKTLRKLREYE